MVTKGKRMNKWVKQEEKSNINTSASRKDQSKR